MSQFQGLLGLLLIYALCILIARHRGRINWRTFAVGVALLIIFASARRGRELGGRGYLLRTSRSTLAIAPYQRRLTGSFRGEKTGINEFVVFASFGPQIPTLVRKLF